MVNQIITKTRLIGFGFRRFHRSKRNTIKVESKKAAADDVGKVQVCKGIVGSDSLNNIDSTFDDVRINAHFFECFLIVF